jgi:hypothetical protein
MSKMPWVKSDGGRKAAGFKGNAGDCVCRAIAIAADLPYAEVYARLAAETGKQRATKVHPKQRAASASHGIDTGRWWFTNYMRELGFTWTPTFRNGYGWWCTLKPGELPMGRLVVSLSRHSVAVIDGVIYDNHHCSRGRRRCVYGYWQLAANKAPDNKRRRP